MKPIYLFILLLLSKSTFAQLILEHTYSESNYVTLVSIEGEGNKYLSVDSSSKNVLLYNEDHSLWKRINTILPDNSVLESISCVSKKLIDLDDDIELAYSFVVPSSSSAPPLFVTRIYKEDGTILMTLPDVWKCTPVKVNSNWKILAYTTTKSETEVYSVPGAYLSIKRPEFDGSSEYLSLLYPNPMESSATLNYQLPKGTHVAKLKVYDINGKIMREYDITDQFSEILIGRGDLPSGLYTYKLHSSNQIISTKMFSVN